MNEIMKLHGSSKLSVWKPGAIQRLLKQDHSLNLAISFAQYEGALVRSNIVDNLIVSAGKALVGDLMIDDETAGLTYHAIGTGSTTPDISDTDLTTEAARLIFASRSRSSNVITCSVFYTAAQSTYNIAEAGIFGGAAASASADSGILFSHYLQPYDNSDGDYDLTFEYSLTIG